VNTDETTSSSVQPAKTKSLESIKRKRKSSEQVSDVELQAASSLAQMSQKKAKKVVKKIVAAEFDEFLPLSMMTSSRNLARKVFPLGLY
jgi:NAD-dependent SIR2 family protein deacetylase